VRFVNAMEALWDAGESLTLMHADMQPDHVPVHQGCPYFIDWEQARYGTFYIDLPNYFTRDEARLYHQALAERGHAIRLDVFMEHYHEASRYLGFKYIGVGLWFWRAGGANRSDGVHYFLDAALNGR
jgi:aminoglycoside phosphotransferase (APT) family kinase protein